MILGIDCGNHNLKLVGSTTRLLFPRYVSEPKYLPFLDGSERWRVTVDGKESFIGYLAEQEGGSMAFSRDKATHPDTLSLIMGSIAIAYKSSTFLTVKLVTGLPLTDLKSQSEELKKSLLGCHLVNINGRGNQSIMVDDCIVFGEGAGAIWNDVLSAEGKFRRKPQEFERVIDIGYRTVDFATLKNMYYISDQSTSIPLGIYHAQMETYKRISSEVDTLPELVKPDDLSLRNLADQILRTVNKLWLDRSNISLCGGGSILLSKHLPYPVMSEPEWANASGYFKVGKAKWQNEFA